MGLLGDLMMNNGLGATTINEDNDFTMLDVGN